MSRPNSSRAKQNYRCPKIFSAASLEKTCEGWPLVVKWVGQNFGREKRYLTPATTVDQNDVFLFARAKNDKHIEVLAEDHQVGLLEVKFVEIIFNGLTNVRTEPPKKKKT